MTPEHRAVRINHLYETHEGILEWLMEEDE